MRRTCNQSPCCCAGKACVSAKRCAPIGCTSIGRQLDLIPESNNGEPRTITMNKNARPVLHRLWVSRGSPTEGPLFLSRSRGYKVPSGSHIKKAHSTACRRGGIVAFHVHDSRHHWASHCVMSGIDLETIHQEGGRKSLRMVSPI